MGAAPSDKDLGIRAQRPVDVRRLGLEGPNAQHAERYEASPPDALDDMLLGLDVDFPRTTFTDLGCGKGRVVCLAALRPFARVVGVELSAALAREAETNVAQLAPRLVKARKVEICAQDAARHRFSSGPRVVYLYNPFRPPVLRKVLSNLLARVDADGAPTFVLYFEPMHRALLDAHPRFTLIEARDRWATYRSRAPE